MRSVSALPMVLVVACYNRPSAGDGGTDGSSSSGGMSVGETPGTTVGDTPGTTPSSTTDDSETASTSSASDPDSGSGEPTTEDPTGTSSADASSSEGSSTTGDPTLAESSSSDDGPATCTPVGDDCGAGEFCDAPDCVSMGVCVASPVATSGTMAPACGCDDTTYWNVDHAHWLGATAFATGTANGCASGTACTGDGDCDSPGAECVNEHSLGPSSCDDGDQGSCWAIPGNADCSVTPPLPDVGFGSCASGPNTCTAGVLNFCEALIDGNFFAICL